MGKRSKKKTEYVRLREKESYKRIIGEKRNLEKFKKANQRKKLKTRIKMRLKKLTRVINLNYQYLS